MTNHFKRLVFNHANLKKPIHVVAGTLVAYHYSDATASVHVYTTGGGIFPVLESIEQIDQALEKLNNGPVGQEKKDV